MNDPQPQKPKEVLVVRDYIAIAITAVSIVGVLVLAAVCIWFNHDKAQEILTTVLPVIGTWVGTVLAFYFSKENLESATRSITAIVGQLTPSDKLKQILAKDKVIKKDQMFSKTTPESSINLLGTLDDLEKTKKGDRIPVLDAQDQPKYVVHRSTIDQYLTAQARKSSPPDLKTLTLQSLIDDSTDLKKRLEGSFVTVSETATLQDAKAAMDAVASAQDVFVTKNGTAKEPIIGWITNNIIADNARV